MCMTLFLTYQFAAFLIGHFDRAVLGPKVPRLHVPVRLSELWRVSGRSLVEDVRQGADPPQGLLLSAKIHQESTTFELTPEKFTNIIETR